MGSTLQPSSSPFFMDEPHLNATVRYNLDQNQGGKLFPNPNSQLN